MHIALRKDLIRWIRENARGGWTITITCHRSGGYTVERSKG
jgi:hypothetical protein